MDVQFDLHTLVVWVAKSLPSTPTNSKHTELSFPCTVLFTHFCPLIPFPSLVTINFPHPILYTTTWLVCTQNRWCDQLQSGSVMHITLSWWLNTTHLPCPKTFKPRIWSVNQLIHMNVPQYSIHQNISIHFPFNLKSKPGCGLYFRAFFLSSFAKNRCRSTVWSTVCWIHDVGCLISSFPYTNNIKFSFKVEHPTVIFQKSDRLVLIFQTTYTLMYVLLNCWFIYDSSLWWRHFYFKNTCTYIYCPLHIQLIDPMINVNWSYDQYYFKRMDVLPKCKIFLQEVLNIVC